MFEAKSKKNSGDDISISISGRAIVKKKLRQAKKAINEPPKNKGSENEIQSSIDLP